MHRRPGIDARLSDVAELLDRFLVGRRALFGGDGARIPEDALLHARAAQLEAFPGKKLGDFAERGSPDLQPSVVDER